MASTYSTNLKIELQATGENSGTWGTITNTNLGTALEQAIVGYGNPNYASDANLTLTYTDTNAAQAARALVLNVTSGVSLTGTRELVVPTIQKQYIVQNNTTGSQSITVKTSAGTGITVPNGRKAHLYVNGTDVIFMDDFVDINGGAIDGTPIGANSASTGAFTTLSSTGNTTIGSDASDTVTVNADVASSLIPSADDTHDLGAAGSEWKDLYVDGTANIDSLVADTADINGGTIDGTTIGGSSAAAGTFTTATATTGNITTVNATTVDATNVEVTNIKAKDGTAAASIADSTGVVSITANPILSGGTANGVLYLNGSKVATSGSALTFDGTTFGVTSTWGSNSQLFTNATASNLSGIAARYNGANKGYLYFDNSTSLYNLYGEAGISLAFTANAAEGMRLTSTGLGIGTSSANARLQVNSAVSSGSPTAAGEFVSTGASGTGSGAYINIGWNPSNSYAGAVARIAGVANSSSATELIFSTSSGISSAPTERMRLDSSGNLGIGTTSPGAKLDVQGSATDFVAFNGLNTNNSAGTITSSAIKFGFTSTVGTHYATLKITEDSVNSNGGNLTISLPNSGVETTKLTLDYAGNLGLGVTPSAWADYKALQTTGAAFMGFSDGASNNQAIIAANAFFTTASTWKYVNTDNASYYQQYDGQHIWFTAPSGTAGNAITFTQAMTLDASGNLGIGTTSPSTRLTVSGSNTAARGQISVVGASDDSRITLYRDSTFNAAFGSSNSDSYIGTESNTPFRFLTNGSERGRFTAGGYFKASNGGTYFGSTGSYHELRQTANDVCVIASASDANYSSTIFYADTVRAANAGFNLASWRANGVTQFEVSGNGVIYAQNTTVQSLSDGRLKENVSDATDGLNVINALRPVRYDWKAGYGNDRKNQLGFIAQEMEAVFPDAVAEWKVRDDEEAYKTVGPGALIPVLVKAMQEQQAMINELKAKVAALEA